MVGAHLKEVPRVGNTFGVQVFSPGVGARFGPVACVADPLPLHQHVTLVLAARRWRSSSSAGSSSSNGGNHWFFNRAIRLPDIPGTPRVSPHRPHTTTVPATHRPLVLFGFTCFRVRGVSFAIVDGFPHIRLENHLLIRGIHSRATTTAVGQ